VTGKQSKAKIKKIKMPLLLLFFILTVAFQFAHTIIHQSAGINPWSLLLSLDHESRSLEKAATYLYWTSSLETGEYYLLLALPLSQQ
jgi:hypothetical protein